MAAGVNTGNRLNAQQQTQPGSVTWNAALPKEQKPDAGLLSFASPKAAMPSHITGQQNEEEKSHTHIPHSSVFKKDKLKVLDGNV